MEETRKYTTVMRLIWNSTLAMIAALCPMMAGAAPISVPSGQPVEFYEVIWEEEGDLNIYRFRYIAPQIARDQGRINFEQAEADIKHLCESSALPGLINQNRVADKIIISISDRKVTFGKPAPEATQFFEVYTPDGATCKWEGF